MPRHGPEVTPLECAQSVIEARYGGSRTVREPLKQGTDFHVAEYTPPTEPPKVKERIRPLVSPCDQFEQPHFRRAKPRRPAGEFFLSLIHI